MTLRSRRAITAAVLSLFIVAIHPVELGAQRKAPKKKAAAKTAPAQPRLSGTLEQRLATLLNGPVARNSTASVEVVDVESGRVVASLNPNLAVAPASNMKLFTTAAALDLLGADFTMKTTVAVRGEIDRNGNLDGDVKIVGRGDPTIGSRFHDGDSTAVLKRFATELKAAGIRTIRGDLILEFGYFDTEWVHPTWPPDQLVNWYEAPIAALSVQEGCVMVRVLPSRPGQRAIVQLEPPNTFMTVENTCVTGPGRGVFVTRRLGTNTIIVRGNVPPRSGATEIFVTVEHPVHYFGNVTHVAFEREGINVQGEVRLVESDDRPGWRTVVEHETPITLVNVVVNKKSQNHYAEQLLKAIGAEKSGKGSFESGAVAVEEWMASRLGIPAAQFDMVDGSGMSRFNRASAHAFIQVLRYMWNTPFRRDFVSSMPYSGETDSRLRRRLNTQPYARQVYAKTGYISGVIGLSGYVHAKSGRIYAFSFLFNRYTTGVWGVYSLQDEMLKEIIDHG
jgi:serine-type D-Ala-D-Ala carboxypeptidase/endopeptidase (penicillin-binding protein 4)